MSHANYASYGGHIHLRQLNEFEVIDAYIKPLTICPELFLIISGKNAFKVQKCASILTPNVLNVEISAMLGS